MASSAFIVLVYHCTFVIALFKFCRGLVSDPVIDVIPKNSEELLLRCESKGWYPEPKVLWLDGEGNVLSAGPTETVRGPDDLYTVSSRVTVDETQGHRFSCRVQQNNIHQSRETHIYIYRFITDSLGSACHTVFIIIIIIAVVVAFGCTLVWKREKKLKRQITNPLSSSQ